MRNLDELRQEMDAVEMVELGKANRGLPEVEVEYQPVAATPTVEPSSTGTDGQHHPRGAAFWCLFTAALACCFASFFWGLMGLWDAYTVCKEVPSGNDAQQFTKVVIPVHVHILSSSTEPSFMAEAQDATIRNWIQQVNRVWSQVGARATCTTVGGRGA